MQAEREYGTVQQVLQWLRDDTKAFSSAFVGVGGSVGAMGTFKTRLFKPKWSAEIIPALQKVWKVLIAVACLGNFFELDLKMLPWVFLLVITLPFEDFSSSGKQRGDTGKTGWMLHAAALVVLAMPSLEAAQNRGV